MKYLKTIKAELADWVYDSTKKQYYKEIPLESANDIIVGLYKILDPTSETRKDDHVEKVDLDYEYNLIDRTNPKVKIWSLHIFDGWIAYLHDIDFKVYQELFDEDDWVLNTASNEYELESLNTGYVVDVFEEKNGTALPVELNSITKKRNSIKLASVHKFTGYILYVK